MIFIYINIGCCDFFIFGVGIIIIIFKHKSISENHIVRFNKLNIIYYLYFIYIFLEL
jgi:hypothetical protein